LPSTLVFQIAGGANTVPFGNYEGAGNGTNAVSVQGWAIDPDSTGSIEIDVWIDGSFGGYGYANLARDDVKQAYPSAGPNHGFSFSVGASPGAHNVCVYAIDANVPSLNTALGCRTATSTQPVDHPPIGNVEAAVRSPGGISVQGWSIDPDTTAPLQMHLYVDGAFAGYGTANMTRADVGAAYPGFGNNHGFDLVAPMPDGTHTVCVYAIDVGGSVNPNLGCRTVTISSSPFGNLESGSRSGTSATLQGWAIDPDTTGIIEIDIWSDGQFLGYGYASLNRPDVGALFTRYGANHGYTLTVAAGSSPRVICAYAINVYAGSNVELGCTQV
jgi:hypothetical protein